MTSRCQGLFPPHPCFKGKALGTRLTSTDQFSAATKTLVLGNFFKFGNLPSHSHEHFAIGDNEKNKTIVIFSSSISPLS